MKVNPKKCIGCGTCVAICPVEAIFFDKIGNAKIDVKKLNIDMLSLSGHKFYAPKGVGALYVRKGIDFEKLQDGGEQESNKRAGTENIAEIVGLGKAIELIYHEFEEYNKKNK